MDMPADRRTELLDKIVAALLTSGVGDLSLRPLAERVGSSARLLIYHFESKENLITAALARVRSRIQTSLAEQSRRERPQSLRALLMMVWEWATDATNQPYFRLLFEVDGLAMFDRISLSDAVKQAGSATWITRIEQAAATLPIDGAVFAAHSTLIQGAFAGLLQEFLSTGDRERTTAALVALIDLVAASAPAQSRKPQDLTHD